MTEPHALPGLGFADADQRTVHIDKPKRQKGTGVMHTSWLSQITDTLHCDACMSRKALGLLSLHTEDGHHVASWWTCGPCADHDAPIHTARGLVVAVVVTETCL